MNSNLLSMFRTHVVCLLGTLALASLAKASTTAVTSINPPNSCQTAENNLQQANEAFGRFCNSADTYDDCKKLVKECSEMETSFGVSARDNPEIECPENLCSDSVRNANRDYRDDKKAAGNENKSQQQNRDDAAQKMIENQKKARDEANKAQDEMMKAQRELRDKRKQMMDELQSKVAGADNQKIEALQKAQEKYDQMDQEYIKMRKELRERAYKINNAEFRWKVECKGQADDLAKQVELAWDKRMVEEDTRKTNVGFTSFAGRKNRRTKKKRDKMLEEYNVFLSKCLNGESGAGLQHKTSIDQFRWESQAAQEAAKDQSARLEKLRFQTQDMLTQLVKSVDENKQNLIKTTQETLQHMETDNQQDQMRLMQRAQQAQQDAQQQQMMDMMKLMQFDGAMGAAKADQAGASKMAQCQSSGVSSAQMRETQKGFGDAMGAASKARAACGSLADNACAGYKDKTRALCGTFDAIMAQARRNGTSSRPTTGSQ